MPIVIDGVDVSTGVSKWRSKMATFKTSSLGGGDMPDEVLADKHYYLDDEGNVTTDELKAAHWLVREGALVTPEAQALIDKVAPAEEEKSAKPAANKAEKPAKNKGVK
jgi:hypothetical protein